MNSEQIFQLLLIHAGQIAVLAFCVAIVVRVAGRKRPWLAHGLWVVVLLKCVTPPLWGHSLGVFCHPKSPLTVQRDSPAELNSVDAHKSHSSSVSVVAPSNNEWTMTIEPRAIHLPSAPDIASAVEEADASSSTVVPAEPVPASFIVDGYRLLLWGLGAGIVLNFGMLIIRLMRWRRQVLGDRNPVAEEQLQGRVEKLAGQLGVRSPRLVVSMVAAGPAVVGFCRQTIVLPSCLVERQTEGILDPILAHELLHIRRRDLWTGLLQAVTGCLWWFHPAVRFACRAISHEAERCCDEQVLAELKCTPAEYARSLLSVMEHQQLRAAPVFPGVKPVELTTQRMERIMSLTNGCRSRMPLTALVCLLLLGVIVLPGASAFTEPSNEPRQEEPESPRSQAQSKPIPFDQAAHDLVQQLNQQRGELNSWRSSDVKLKVSLPATPPLPEMKGSVACEAPNRFYLTARNTLASVTTGFNAEHGWFQSTPGHHGVISWQHDDAQQLSMLPVPLSDTDWLMKVLGVNALDPYEYTLDRSIDPDATYRMLARVNENPGRQVYRHTIKVSTEQPTILEHAAYGNDRKLIATATLSDHQMINGHLIPQTIRVEVPSTKTTLKLTVSTVETNAKIESVMWQVPSVPEGENVLLRPTSSVTTVRSLALPANKENQELALKVDQQISFQCEDQTLTQIMSQLATENRFNLVLDRSAVAIGRSGADEPTYTVEEIDVPLHNVLDHICNQVQLDWEIADGVIKVSDGDTEAQARSAGKPARRTDRAHVHANSKLDQLVSFRCENRTLTQIMTQLSEEVGFSVGISAAAVRNNDGQENDRKYSFDLDGVSFRTLLNTISRHAQVSWEYDRDILRIDADTEAQYSDRMYQVDELALALHGSISPVPEQPADAKTGETRTRPRANVQSTSGLRDLAPLIALIRTSVRPNSWDRRASISVVKGTAVLKVRQTAEGHAQIRKLLRKLQAQPQIQTKVVVVRVDASEPADWLDDVTDLQASSDWHAWQLMSQQQLQRFLNETRAHETAQTICDGASVVAAAGVECALHMTDRKTHMSVSVDAHPLFDSSWLRLGVSAAWGQHESPLPRANQFYVGPQQTILLDLTSPDDADSHRVLMALTPQLLSDAPATVADDDKSDVAPTVRAGDPPSDREILQALVEDLGKKDQQRLDARIVDKLIKDHRRTNIRIIKELIVDRLEAPQVFPLVGRARRHHCRYKCTVYWDDVVKSYWPIPFSHSTAMQHAVYVDKDRLVADPVVPDLTGMSHKEAEASLSQLGINSINVKMRRGPAAASPQDVYRVKDQKPAPGTPIKDATEVSLDLWTRVY